MSFHIQYTIEAIEDLRNIYEYISYYLLVPHTAQKQIRRIMDSIQKLNEMPERFMYYKENPWHDKGLRFFPVDHYLVFYVVVDNTVFIDRIIYSGRDIRKQLENTDPNQLQ